MAISDFRHPNPTFELSRGGRCAARGPEGPRRTRRGVPRKSGRHLYRISALVLGLLALLLGRCQLVPGPNSMERVTQHFLDCLERGDGECLQGLALSQQEFQTVVWPALPASRPHTNLSAEFVWNQHAVRSLSSLRRTLAHYSGKHFELVEILIRGEVSDYGPFKVYRGSLLRLRDESGQIREYRLFGSFFEFNGQFKVYSFVT